MNNLARTDRASFKRTFLAPALLGILAIWAPVALGSNVPIFWAINGGVASLILLVLLLSEGQPGEIAFDWRGYAIALSFAIGLIAWTILQASITFKSLQHPAWALLSATDRSWGGAISVLPDATLTAAGKFATLTTAAVAAARLASDPRRARQIVYVILLTATAIAAYGLLLELLQSNTILWMERWAYEGYLTGTFVNRNHAATFFGMGLAAVVSLMVSRERSRDGTLRLIWVCAAVLLCLAIIRTGSRAGAASAAIGVAAVISVAYLSGRQVSGSIRASAAVTLAAVVSLAILGKPLLSRLTALDAGVRGRILVYHDTLAALVDRPLLGQGSGAFSSFFPIYRGPELSPDYSWSQAHNSYFETAAGLGVPAFALACLMLAYPVWRMATAVRWSELALPAAVAALGASALVGVHSLFDFPLQIQGVALPFAILFGAGFGEALSSKPRESSFVSEPVAAPLAGFRARRLSQLLGGVLLLLLTLLTARLAIVVGGTPQSLWFVRSPILLNEDATFSAEAAARGEWAAKLVSARDLFAARYGDCSRWPDSTRTGVGCMAALDQGLALTPASGELWVEKARLLLLSGAEPAALLALSNSYDIAPREGWIALRRARLMLLRWPALSTALGERLRYDLEIILRSRTLSDGLAKDFGSDEVVRARLTPLLEASPNTTGVLRFIRLVRGD